MASVEKEKRRGKEPPALHPMKIPCRALEGFIFFHHIHIEAHAKSVFMSMKENLDLFGRKILTMLHLYFHSL